MDIARNVPGYFLFFTMVTHRGWRSRYAWQNDLRMMKFSRIGVGGGGEVDQGRFGLERMSSLFVLTAPTLPVAKFVRRDPPKLVYVALTVSKRSKCVLDDNILGIAAMSMTFLATAWR